MVKRPFLLRNGSSILRSMKFVICSKQAAKGFKSLSNCLVQWELLKSNRPFAAFYNSKRYFFQSFCQWQSQCDAEINSDANASAASDDAVIAFQRILCNKLEAAQREFEKIKKHAIERKWCISLPIQSICANKINFSLRKVSIFN